MIIYDNSKKYNSEYKFSSETFLLTNEYDSYTKENVQTFWVNKLGKK